MARHTPLAAIAVLLLAAAAPLPDATPLPALPSPAVGADARPSEFLTAAAHAIAAGRVGEAQEAMERAESRALDRSVRPSKAGEPSRQALVAQIAQARQALAAGDRMAALRLVEAAAAADTGEPE